MIGFQLSFVDLHDDKELLLVTFAFIGKVA